jgi:hypothetical protein
MSKDKLCGCIQIIYYFMLPWQLITTLETTTINVPDIQIIYQITLPWQLVTWQNPHLILANFDLVLLYSVI